MNSAIRNIAPPHILTASYNNSAQFHYIARTDGVSRHVLLTIQRRAFVCSAPAMLRALLCASTQAQARERERERENDAYIITGALGVSPGDAMFPDKNPSLRLLQQLTGAFSPLNLPIPKLAQGQDCRGDSNRAPLQVRRRNRRPQKAKSSCHHGGVDHSCKSAKVGPALHQRCLHSQNGDSNDVTMSGQPGAK